MKILLVCGAGLSTSLMVQALNEAQKEAKRHEIRSASIGQIADYAHWCELILCAPHISKMYESQLMRWKKYGIPFLYIDEKTYSAWNGQDLMKQIDAFNQLHPIGIALAHSGSRIYELLAAQLQVLFDQQQGNIHIQSLNAAGLELSGKGFKMVLLEPSLAYLQRKLEKEAGKSTKIEILPISLVSRLDALSIKEWIMDRL